MLKKILLDGSVLSVFNIYSFGIVFLNTYLITKFAGIEILGMFSYALSIFSITTVPISNAIVPYIIKEINSTKETIGAIISDSFSYIWLAIPISIFTFFLFTYTSNYNYVIIVKFSILISLSFVKTISMGYLIGTEKVLLGKFPELFIYPTAFLIYLLINRNSLDLYVIVDGFFLSLIINIIVYMILFLNNYKWKSKLYYNIKAKKIKKIFEYSISNLLDALNQNILILFSGFFGLFELSGLYKIILDIFKLPKYIFFSINQVFSPKAAKLFSLKKINSLQYLITKLNILTYVFIILFSCSLILFGDLIMTIFRIDNNDFLLLLYLFILSELISNSSYSGGSVLLMTGQIRYLLLTKIICFSTFLISLLSTYNYGLIGAGLSFVLVSTVQTILVTFYCYRQTKLKLNLIQNYKYVLKKK